MLNFYIHLKYIDCNFWGDKLINVWILMCQSVCWCDCLL